MKKICISCDGKLKNTGISNKDKVFGFTRGILRFPTIADDGTPNFLDLTTGDLDAELLAKLNHVDPSKRLYYISDLENVSSDEADPTFDTSDTNERSLVLKGIKPMTYETKGVSHEYYKQMNTMCVDASDYLVDNCGNLLGVANDDDTEFYGREINRKSYNTKYMNRTTTTAAKIIANYDYALDTDDSQMSMLDVDSFTLVNPLKVKSMIDVNLTVVSVDSATELTLKAELNFGTVGNRVPKQGILPTEIDVIDELTGASVGPLVGLTETTPGNYTATTPVTVTGQNYTLVYFSGAASSNINGFEGKPVSYVSL